MSQLIDTLRAIVRDELARVRPPALGIVTESFARAGDDSDDNHQVSVRLRGSGVELQRVPVAVSRLGLSALPAPDDLVLVSFVDGDLNAPVVLGSVYDDQARPPVGEADEVVYQPPEDAESGVRRLHLELPNGTLLTVEDEVVRLEMGDTTVVVNRDGDVEVNAAGAIKVQAAGDLQLGADGNVEVSAGGDLTLKGMGATSVESGAGTTVKGPQVKLAGMTSFSPS